MALKYEARKARVGWQVVAVSDQPADQAESAKVVAVYHGGGMGAAEFQARQTAEAMQKLYEKQVAGL